MINLLLAVDDELLQMLLDFVVVLAISDALMTSANDHFAARVLAHSSVYIYRHHSSFIRNVPTHLLILNRGQVLLHRR